MMGPESSLDTQLFPACLYHTLTWGPCGVSGDPCTKMEVQDGCVEKDETMAMGVDVHVVCHMFWFVRACVVLFLCSVEKDHVTITPYQSYP